MVARRVLPAGRRGYDERSVDDDGLAARLANDPATDAAEVVAVVTVFPEDDHVGVDFVGVLENRLDWRPVDDLAHHVDPEPFGLGGGLLDGSEGRVFGGDRRERSRAERRFALFPSVDHTEDV